MENFQQDRDRDLPPSPTVPPGTCNLTTASKVDRGEGEKRNSALLEGGENKKMVISTKGVLDGREQVSEKRKQKKEEKRKEKEKKVREKKERESGRELEKKEKNSFSAPAPGWVHDLSTSASSESGGFTATAISGTLGHGYDGIGVYDVDGKYDREAKENSTHSKKVRIICISDTHNQTPSRLPPGDILIHAGDLTNSGTYKELSKVADWLKNLKGYEYKIVLPGNHDLALDRVWVEDFGYEIGVCLEGRRGESEGVKTWEDCVDLFAGEEARRKGVVYLGPEDKDYENILKSSRGRDGEDGESIVGEDGEEERQARVPGKMETLKLNNGVKFTVWGCPGILRILRPELGEEERRSRGEKKSMLINTEKPKRRWAFGYSTPISIEESPWADIPASGIDILITHTPPKYHLDHLDPSALPSSGAIPSESLTGQAGLERATFLGCEFLRRALWKTKPRLHVFGHVHHGRGAQVVRWDTESKWVKWREGDVKEWVDPGGDKMCLVDLTGRGKGKTAGWKVVVEEGKGVMEDGVEIGGGRGNSFNEQKEWSSRGYTPTQDSESLPQTQYLGSIDTPISPAYQIPTHPSTHPTHPTHQTHARSIPSPLPQLIPGKETCLVNASYMPTSYFFRRAMHAAAAAAAKDVDGDTAGDAGDVGGGEKGKKRGLGKMFSEKANVVNKPFVVDLDLDLE